MSILSTLDNMVLFNTNHPPLGNKAGSPLTPAEWDARITAIYDAIQSIVSGANVTAYDAGRTYDQYSTDVYDQFASYDSRIWKASYVGSPSAFSGQTPAEGIYWTQITLAELIPDVLKVVDGAENGYQKPYEETVNIPTGDTGVTITIPSATYSGEVKGVEVWHNNILLTGLIITRGTSGSDNTVTIRSGKAYTNAEITITLK